PTTALPEQMINCREAESLLFAGRDGALDEDRRAVLAEHLQRCPACRATEAALAGPAEAWRRAHAAVPAAAVEPEQQASRRRIRAGDAPQTSPARWARPLGVSLAAAAILTVAAWLAPHWLQRDSSTPGREWTYVSYVTVETASDAAMVYEDPDTGWLLVWV